MSQQTIGVGASANDGTGDPLRTAFTKTNANFTELYGTLTIDRAVADGGTGASDAAGARTNLGLVIGTHVQAYSANLTAYAGVAPSANVLSFLGAANYAAMRTQLSLGSVATLNVDTDGTMAADSDSVVPSQKAVRTYVATAVTGLLDFKGNTDCSGNPNYPAASKGDAYVVSVAGKIGGASGASVDIGDMFVASADNAGGTQASVGSSWFILEHNLVGAASAGAITSSGLTMATARLLGRTTASTGAVEEISVGAGLSLSGGTLVNTGAGGTGTITTAMGITIDGGGLAITAGVKGDLYVPVACTITAATLLADQSGSIVIDIWKDTYANYPPTVADTITASAKPTLSSAIKSQDTTLTGWTLSVAAGTTLRFNVDSAATLTRAHLSLTITVP